MHEVPDHDSRPPPIARTTRADAVAEFGGSGVGARIEAAVVHANRFVVIALMAAMAVLVIANVVMRNMFNASIVWAKGLLRYMMVWVGLLGASVASCLRGQWAEAEIGKT